MAAKKRKPAIELTGEEYNRLKGFYRYANNDLSGSNPTRGEPEMIRHGLGWGVDLSKNRRGRVQQRAITQRKNQQRKNKKKGVR